MIYFVQAPSGPIKIGYVIGDSMEAVAKRLAAFQVGNHERLKVVATCSGKVGLEGILHKKFAADRIHGEWFRPSPDLLEYIQTRCISPEVIETKQITCPICHGKFVPSNSRHTKCSDACRQKKVCIQCGKPFTPEKWWKKFYCSLECYDKG